MLIFKLKGKNNAQADPKIILIRCSKCKRSHNSNGLMLNQDFSRITAFNTFISTTAFMYNITLITHSTSSLLTPSHLHFNLRNFQYFEVSRNPQNWILQDSSFSNRKFFKKFLGSDPAQWNKSNFLHGLNFCLTK